MPGTFYSLITEAVADFAAHGYDSETRLDEWLARIRAAALEDMIPEAELTRQLQVSLRNVYERLVERGGLMKALPGLPRFTLDRVRPRLRNELDRRILAAASLIKLNRQEAVENTLRRFVGWATAIPLGGSEAVAKNPVKTGVRKALAQLPYVERRCLIDQGHKLLANLSEIVAHDGGALAGVWHQHYTRNPRAAHRARDGKVYAVRDNWASERGLMKVGPAGYTDGITRPGEEVYCRCTMTWLMSLRQLPADMITDKGRAELERVRRAA